MRNYKFRLYPTDEQESRLVETLDGCRWVYNYFYKNNMSAYDMQFALTEMKEQHLWLYNYHSKMLQMVVHRIDAARKALSVLRRNGHKIGRLHYRTHEEFNSFVYNQSGFKIGGNQLWLSKMGRIKIRLHRQPVNVKQVTVVRQAGKWYAVVACEIAKPIFRFIDPCLPAFMRGYTTKEWTFCTSSRQSTQADMTSYSWSDSAH
jgi:putative transposase